MPCMVEKTYYSYFATKLILDLARLDGFWGMLADELEEILDTHASDPILSKCDDGISWRRCCGGVGGGGKGVDVDRGRHVASKGSRFHEISPKCLGVPESSMAFRAFPTRISDCTLGCVQGYIS